MNDGINSEGVMAQTGKEASAGSEQGEREREFLITNA